MVLVDKVRKKATVDSDASLIMPKEFKRLSSSLVLTHDDTFNIMELWDGHKDVCAPDIILRNVPARPVQIAYDAQGQKLAALFKEGSVKVWNMESSSGQPHAEFQEYENIKVMLCAKDYLVMGTAEGKVKFWDLNTQECVAEHKKHYQAINCMTLLGNGSIAAGSQDCYASVYNLANRICYLRLHNKKPIQFITSMGHDTVVTASQDGCNVWDTQQKKCIGGYNLSGYWASWPIRAVQVLHGMVALYLWDKYESYYRSKLFLIDAQRNKVLFNIEIVHGDWIPLLSKQTRTYTPDNKIYDYDLRFACLSDESLIKAAQLLKEKMIKHGVDRPTKYRSGWIAPSRYITQDEIFDILKQSYSE
jgi:WD40 repeat protein